GRGAVARRDPLLLGAAGACGAPPAADRDRADRRPARVVRAADRARRAGDALRNVHRAGAAPAGRIHRCRARGTAGGAPMKRLFPSPLLSVSLFVLWLVLARSASVGQLIIATIVAIAMPLLTAPLRPLPVRIRRPLTLVRLILVVGHDVLLS